MIPPLRGTTPGHSADGAHAPAPQAEEPRVGDRIGPYRLVKLLGEGSTGRVFEVEHEKIGRRAAMKTLSADHAGRPGAIRRLFTEALAVNRINNPHIVEVTDLVEAGQHHLVTGGKESTSSLRVNALVMELLEGQSLGRAMLTEGPMPPERFLPLLAQVCQALAAAHLAGFIHRDLKPDNIFLTERAGVADFVKLLDFGLAKTLNVDPALLQDPALATVDGTFVGTPGYVSPEQAAGKTVDHRTDIYALGVILYEIVCGRLPFEGKSIGDFLILHITAPPPSLPDEILATKLGRTLDAIVQRCLAKDPAARFPTAARLGQIFSDLARGEDVPLTSVDSHIALWSPRRFRWRKRMIRAGLGLAAGLVLALVTGFIVARSRRTDVATGAAGAVASEPAPVAARPPAAAPSTPAPASARVTLSFESDPPGAEVLVLGSGQPLGVTPFERAFERSDEPMRLELRRGGYEPVHIATSATASRIINVTLTRSVPPPPPPSPPPRRASAPAAAQPLDRDITINPFR